MEPAPKMVEEIFPLEVWEMILDEVESPLDLSNCSKTCTAWMKLLKKKRTTYLMAEVFPILRKYLDAEEEDDDDSNASDIADERPGTILNMRLVCKSWKFGVDNDIQNDRNHSNIGFDTSVDKEDVDPFNLRPIRPSYAAYEFSVIYDGTLSDFVNSDLDTDTNPFISRFISYDERMCYCYNIQRDARKVTAVRKDFTLLLKLYGSHIWHAILDLHVWKEDIGYNQRMAYNLVKRFLDLMPNLRTLQVMFHLDECISITHSTLRQIEPDLAKQLKKKPLPKLVHLTTLTMKDVPAPLENGLLMKNQHILKLSFESTPSELTPATALPDFLKDLPMENLEEWKTSVNSEDDLTTLETLPWPVNSLRIHFQNVKLDSCFQSVSASQISSTLKHLIVCPLKEKDVVGGTGNLETPHLKALEMIVPAKLKNVDFLLPICATLVNLKLTMKMDARKDADRVHAMTTRSVKKNADESRIEFDGYTSRMQESNIWTLLPVLKRLKIVKKVEWVSPLEGSCHGTCFMVKENESTREEYNALQRNQN